MVQDEAGRSTTGATGAPAAPLPLVTRVGRAVTRRFKRRPVVFVAGTVAAAVLATSGLSYAAVHHFTGAVEHIDVFSSLTDRPDDDGAINILVVGSDDRSGMSEEERLALSLGIEDFGRQTDTMMIAHVAASGAVDVISLPRDSAVQIPAFTTDDGEVIDSHEAKLNSAYSIGGPQLLAETVEDATGVRLDHYVEVDFTGFIDIVNALGGVEVCTMEPITDEMSGLNLPAGTSTLDGASGLSYVRARYFDPSADIGRIDRQQQFLGSMFRKATSTGVLMNPVRLGSTVDAVLASLTADENLSPDKVRTLMRALQGTTPDEVSFLTLPLTDEPVYLDDGGEAVAWNRASTDAIFAALRSPASVTESIRSAMQSLPEVEVAPAEVHLTVLNGSGVAGAAGRAGDQLMAAGFVVDAVGNGSPTARTRIEYNPDDADGLATLTTALPDAEVVEDPNLTGGIQVTVGPDFSGTAGFRVAGQPEEQQAPAAAAATEAPLPTSAAENPCA